MTTDDNTWWERSELESDQGMVANIVARTDAVWVQKEATRRSRSFLHLECNDGRFVRPFADWEPPAG